ncbi:replication initiation protein [Leptotrichia wadei]|jgi:putative replication protein rep|uniref:replication initiation protein n=1 Tax=Leptotrichia wadei TaxID=157687 RepID=UPI00352DF97F
MANEVVKFNNDMNTVALRKFNSVEINLLMAICSRIREQGLKHIEFDFRYLKHLTKFPYDDMKSFVNTLDKSYSKLLECHIRIGDDIEWTRFVLFTKYTINVEKQIITIGINEEFKYILNELTSNFTRFELDEFVNFKSTYTKEFYRRMKQFRYTGIWIVDIEEFKYLMDIPLNYKIDTIDKKVFKPIINELGENYNLKIIKKYKKGLGRGRSRVSGFEFRFKKSNKKQKTDEAKDLAKILFENNLKTFDYAQANAYINRKIKIFDKIFDRYNYLSITNFKESKEQLIVTLKNVDDGHIQYFKFNNFNHFENWFRKYAI